MEMRELLLGNVKMLRQECPEGVTIRVALLPPCGHSLQLLIEPEGNLILLRERGGRAGRASAFRPGCLR
jgi:hypothetical protein